MANMQEAWQKANQEKEQERREKEQALRKNMSVLESKEKTIFRTNEVITSIRKVLASRIIEYALNYNISVNKLVQLTNLNRSTISRILQCPKEKTVKNNYQYTVSINLLTMVSICAFYNMKPVIISKYKDEKMAKDLKQIEKDIVKICKKNGKSLVDTLSKVLISQTQYIIANKVIRNNILLTNFADSNGISPDTIFAIMGRGSTKYINSIKNKRILIRSIENILESLGCYIKIVSIDDKPLYFDKDYAYLYDKRKLNLYKGRNGYNNINLKYVNEKLSIDPYYNAVVPSDEQEYIPDFDDTIVKQALMETDKFEDANETKPETKKDLVEVLETVPMEEEHIEEIQVVPKSEVNNVEVELMIGGVKITVPAEVVETETGKKVKLSLDLSFNM